MEDNAQGKLIGLFFLLVLVLAAAAIFFVATGALSPAKEKTVLANGNSSSLNTSTAQQGQSPPVSNCDGGDCTLQQDTNSISGTGQETQNQGAQIPDANQSEGDTNTSGGTQEPPIIEPPAQPPSEGGDQNQPQGGTLTNGVACGIYALDDKTGTYRDGQIGMTNYSYVTGYSWRMGWSSFESSQGNYDFSGVDHIISKLEQNGKKLSINAGLASEPQYVVNAASATWVETRNPGGQKVTVTHPVPWDAFAQQRFAAFVSALANHPVYSSALGKAVPLRDHPVLANIDLGVVGLGAIRGSVANISGYSRNNLENSVLFSLKTTTDNFPNKNVFVGFWVVNDSSSNPPLTSDLETKILSQFDGVSNPKVGFFMENLAASNSGGVVTGYPSTSYAAPEYDSRNKTPILFQALQGWSQPFQDASKTQGGTPDDGINYGYNTFNSKYYEIYAADLKNQSYSSIFTKWNNKLCS